MPERLQAVPVNRELIISQARPIPSLEGDLNQKPAAEYFLQLLMALRKIQEGTPDPLSEASLIIGRLRDSASAPDCTELLQYHETVLPRTRTDLIQFSKK